MADEAPPDEPIFRSNKRRKVVRRRTDALSPAVSAAEEQDPITHQASDDDDATVRLAQLQKRGGAKKQGIAFTSTSSLRAADEAVDEERALIPVDEDAEQDRFVRPTGRVAVTDNQHMTAYIDSKLAEMRPSTGAPVQHIDTASSSTNVRPKDLDTETGDIASTSKVLDCEAVPTTSQQAQARSTREYQRPTKRRIPKPRDQADVTRDSIIDQIMRESEVPHYERAKPSSPGATGEEVDNDAAAAEAFKAQLLAEMQQNNRRRAPPSSDKSKDTKTSSGPKLGGSRAQRERMRAMEEAKSGGPKK